MELLPNSENPFNNSAKRNFDQKDIKNLQMLSVSKKRRTNDRREIYEEGFSKNFQNLLKSALKKLNITTVSYL
jgi:hypothetical protein